MESSQPLAIESFSNSWLINSKPSFDVLDQPRRTSFDFSTGSSSKKFFEEAQNFKFDVPTSQYHRAQLHADELFSNGFIIPFFVDPSRAGVFNTSNSHRTKLASARSARTAWPSVQINCHFLGRWRRSSKILLKYLGFLAPSCQKLGAPRKHNRVESVDSRAWEVKSWAGSPTVAPQRNISHSRDNEHEMEGSINDAVLHCKKSREI